MKSYVKYVLIALIAATIGHSSHSGDYWIRARNMLQRYSWPTVGALAGGGLGYGLGRYVGYPRATAATFALMGGFLGESIRPLWSFFQIHKRELDAHDQLVEHIRDINHTTAKISMMKPMWHGPDAARLVQVGHPNPRLTPIYVGQKEIEDYVRQFRDDKISLAQLVTLNTAIIDCLKNKECFSAMESEKRKFLKNFFTIYANPEKEAENNALIATFYDAAQHSAGAIADRPQNPLPHETINEVAEYLDQADNNKFGIEGLFYERRPKKALR